MKKTLLLAGVACLFASQANAEGYFFKPYLGLDYVHSWGDYTVDKDDNNVTKNNVSAGAASVGFQFHRNIGLELFYQQSAEAKKNYGAGYITEDGQEYPFEDLKTYIKYKALGADLMGYIPLNNKFNVLLSLGAGRYKIEGKAKIQLNEEYYTVPEIEESESESKWGLRVGGGFQYFLTDQIAGRIMVRYTYIGHNEIDFEKMVDVTAGIRFYF